MFQPGGIRHKMSGWQLSVISIFYTVASNPSKGPDNAASDPIMAKATASSAGKYDYGGGDTV